MTAKSVTKKEQTAMTVADDLYADENYITQDELSADSYAVPRLALLEKMSPQVDESEAEFIEGAKPGMIFNSVTNEIYDVTDEALKIIPCLRKHVFVEWVTREDGGGFVAVYDYATGRDMMKQTTRDEKNRDILSNGHELQETMEFYVLYLDPNNNELTPAVISMARTRMKEAKRWNFRIDNRVVNGRKLKDIAQVYDMKSAQRKGDQGTSYVWKAGDSLTVDQVFDDYRAAMQHAIEFRTAVASGERGVDYNDTTAQQHEDIPEEQF